MLSCIIASQNLKKRNELQQLLPSSFTFLLPSEIGFFDSIAETENSFEGNARLKTQAMQNFALSKKLNASIIADDSGLEVEALNGAPGVYSARFAGENANDAENVQLLLLKLKGVDYTEVKIDEVPEAREFIVAEGHKTVPQIYYNGKLLVEGGYQGLARQGAEFFNQLKEEHVNQ